jgi:hypothetical protein
MKDHSEFPTKPNYQAIAESLEAENKILTEQVELQTKRLETLQQGVKDASKLMEEFKVRCHGIETQQYEYKASGIALAIEILTEKTGISA